MSEVRGVVAQVTAWLPGGLGQRVRVLFAVFALLLAPLPVLGLAATDTALWPNAAIVLVAALVMGGWSWGLYQRNGLPLWTDVVPWLGIVAVGWASGTTVWVIGLLFVLLCGRMLYDTGTRAWWNVLGYYLAYQAAVVVARSEATEVLTLVTMAFAILVSAAVMLVIGEVIRAHERMAGREEVLAIAASRLQRAAVHDQIYDVAGGAALELCEGGPEAAVTVWRGNTHTLRIDHAEGQLAEDQAVEVPLDTIPDDLYRRLLAGEPFELDEEASALVRHAVGMDATYASILIAPLVHGGRFGGALAVSSRHHLPDDLVAALGRLGADVGLALDRADSTLLLSRTVENSSDAIILLDPGCRVDLASEAAGSLFGRAPADLVGVSIADLLITDARGIEAIMAAVADGPNDAMEVVTACYADGARRPVELAATRLADAGAGGWVVNLRDVTRRLEAEEALRASERRFRSLTEHVSEGMYRMVLDPEPRYEYVNPAMEEMCGFPAQAFLDDPDLALRHIHPDDRELLERTRVGPDEVQWPLEARWLRPDGQWVWFSFRETILHDDAGRPVGSMGIVSDITARKRQERALARALDTERDLTEQLRRVDSMRTTFIQAVSHELRTPLTAITGYSRTLLQHHERLGAGQFMTLLERLDWNADKLDRLLADLLDVDRLSSHVLEPSRRMVDVLGLVRGVIDQIEPTSHPVLCEGDEVTARLDAPKVERIVENLVRNAMKHTRPGTSITVTVAADPEGDGAVLTVVDDGEGVTEELLGHVFEPFIQGPESATAATPGMGIGLSLVARFAELHGGHARVRNREQGGAAFEVWLPGEPPHGSGGAVRQGASVGRS